MAEDIGTTEPTAERVATARHLRALHQRDERDCWWCGQVWPCAADRWSGRVLKRAAAW